MNNNNKYSVITMSVIVVTDVDVNKVIVVGTIEDREKKSEQRNPNTRYVLVLRYHTAMKSIHSLLVYVPTIVCVPFGLIHDL